MKIYTRGYCGPGNGFGFLPAGEYEIADANDWEHGKVARKLADEMLAINLAQVTEGEWAAPAGFMPFKEEPAHEDVPYGEIVVPDDVQYKDEVGGPEYIPFDEVPLAEADPEPETVITPAEFPASDDDWDAIETSDDEDEDGAGEAAIEPETPKRRGRSRRN